MATKSIQWKPYLQNSGKFYLKILITKFLCQGKASIRGLSLSELLVGIIIASIIVNVAFMGFSWSRKTYLSDQKRNDIDQTLRSVFEIVGSDIRQAGEGLTTDPNFPILLITQNAGNSEIRIRRSLLAVNLPVCRRVVAGTSTNVFVVDTGTVAGCSVVDDDNNGWPDALKKWKDYRSSKGTTVRAFIYNGAGNGELFDYNGETNFRADNSVVTTPTPGTVASGSVNANAYTWKNTYEANGSSRLYLIEERSYRLNGNTLELVINDNQTTKIIGGLEKFQILANIQQSLSNSSTQTYVCSVIPPVTSTSCNTTLATAYVASQIKSIEIKAKALNDSSVNIQSEQSQKIFPRNVLNY